MVISGHVSRVVMADYKGICFLVSGLRLQEYIYIYVLEVKSFLSK